MNPIQEILLPGDTERPKWLDVLDGLAEEMRHDINPHLIERIWKPKLKRYSDEIISQAIMRGQWKIFPNVNEVIEEIQMLENERSEDRKNREWEDYKAKQKAAEEQGLLATDEDYAEMNAALKRIAQSAPMPAPVPKPTEAYTPPPPAELERRKQEQLKAVQEKYGNRK